MDVQSLLFSRAAGWTPSKAKAWAKSHGFKHGKVHTTAGQVRIRQFDPKGLKVKRTVPFGHGIQAVVAREREEEMAAKRRRSKKAAAPRRHRRRAREAAVTEAPWTKAKRRAAGKKAAKTRKRRKAQRRAAARRGAARRKVPIGPLPRKYNESRRRRRRKPAALVMEAPRRRRHKRRRVQAAPSVAAPRRRRRRHARAREAAPVMQASRRRRRHRRHTYEAQAPRRRHYHARARGGGGGGFGVGQFAVAGAAAASWAILAGGVDRLLATYNPTAANKPADKFTSDGAGTLANTLNIASPPHLLRLASGVGFVAVPAIATRFIKNPYVQAGLIGATLGGVAQLFSLLWSNVIVPLLKPKDTSNTGLSTSFIARLYPAEVAAAINIEAKTQALTGGTATGLSGAEAGVGAPDVGPFALSDYPDAQEALRRQAGMAGPGGPAQPGTPGMGEYPTAAQALRHETGVGQPIHDAIYRHFPQWGADRAQWAAQIALNQPYNIVGALQQAYPGADNSQLYEAARWLHPHVHRHWHRWYSQQGQQPVPIPSPPVPQPAMSTAAVPPPPSGVSQPPDYSPGPPSTPGPGPQIDGSSTNFAKKECACLGDGDLALGFIGEPVEADQVFVNFSSKAA